MRFLTDTVFQFNIGVHLDNQGNTSGDKATNADSPRHEGVDHIEQFFAYGHLPVWLQEVSKPFSDLATVIVGTLPRNPERTVALRKLLESKDAAVRAKLAK